MLTLAGLLSGMQSDPLGLTGALQLRLVRGICCKTRLRGRLGLIQRIRRRLQPLGLNAALLLEGVKPGLRIDNLFLQGRRRSVARRE
jgi:hypothetical protein